VTDFAAIIAMQIEADWEIEVEEIHPHQDAPYTLVAILATPDEAAGSVLAAKVPELCLTCGGERDGAHGNIVAGDCPDCPTIGHLLAIGAAVMAAEVSGGWIVQLPGQLATNTADLLLTQLRAATP